MKILILSDSHMISRSDLYTFFNYIKADHIIHCGDIYPGYQELSLPNFSLVKGNNDFSNLPSNLILTIDSLRFFICHGHQHHVNSDLTLLEDLANKNIIDILCFGHTHIPYTNIHQNTIFINPGSLMLPRGRTNIPTYCIFDTVDKKVEYYNFKTFEKVDPFTIERVGIFDFLKKKKRR